MKNQKRIKKTYRTIGELHKDRSIMNSLGYFQRRFNQFDNGEMEVEFIHINTKRKIH